MVRIKTNNYLLKWIEGLFANGKYVFTYNQACTHFKEISSTAITLALNRLSHKQKISSVFKGFYVIVSPEYSLKGIIPPILFIDALMTHLNRSYYVGLLSAAALHGAAHQRPQEFFVVTTFPQLRPTIKKGIKINYIVRINISGENLENKKTDAGYVKVSNPELTSIDLIQYEKHIGGMNRAATVINELTDAMNIENLNKTIIAQAPLAILQRLGYILENIAGRKDLSDNLFKLITTKLKRTPLKAGKSTKGCTIDKKWKVIINTKIEIDE